MLLCKVADFELTFKVFRTAINVILKNIFAFLLLNMSLDLFLAYMTSRATVIASCPEIVKAISKMLFIVKIP